MGRRRRRPWEKRQMTIRSAFFAMSVLAAFAPLHPVGAAAQEPGKGVPPELKTLYDAAVKEGGGIVIYSQIVPTTLESFADQWNKRFSGVKLEYVRLTTAPLIERVNAELASGK